MNKFSFNINDFIVRFLANQPQHVSEVRTNFGLQVYTDMIDSLMVKHGVKGDANESKICTA
jgi:hypothetical protein